MKDREVLYLRHKVHELEELLKKERAKAQMKAQLIKTSDWKFHKKVEVETIEDILKFNSMVVLRELRDDELRYEGCEDCEIEIEIYDDYRE